MFGSTGGLALQNAFAATPSPAQKSGGSRLNALAASGFQASRFGGGGGGGPAAGTGDTAAGSSQAFGGWDDASWQKNTDWIRAHARLGSARSPLSSAVKWTSTAKRELLSKSFGTLLYPLYFSPAQPCLSQAPLHFNPPAG